MDTATLTVPRTQPDPQEALNTLMEDNDLIPIEAFMALAGLARKTLSNSPGRYPRQVRLANSFFMRRSEVDRWVKAHMAKGKS
ncbi:hypothetical protein [Roseomonas sp. CECT 9278]|uniref:hypothetical protein n=1 Tax=Roseomonas sp. CECT 9278 TaxID=2845823 RepID=UPI001E57FA59|nr:hypothetical protein [Roseomonas sp. CECT 9278]CAH0169460.1 hypothetical protein ROS9278_01159 [Roseomonas sp. CECT 9278]